MSSHQPIKVALVGYGRLARHLAPALLQGGAKIESWWIRDQDDHQEVEDKFGVAPVADVEHFHSQADAILLLVNDEAIPSVSAAIHPRDAIVCHVSGTTPLSALEHPHCGIFYPLNTFNGRSNAWNADTPILLQSRHLEDLTLLNTLANRISSQVRVIDENDLPIIHLSAVIAQNFSNHLIAKSENLLRSHALPRELIQPLLKTMVENLINRPAYENQTGPGVRGDQATIQTQIESLTTNKDLQKIYQQITTSIIQDHFA